MAKEKKNKHQEKNSFETAEKKESGRSNISARGRIFEGMVKKKFPKRIVIEFDRLMHVKKYERYKRSRTKIHARLPEQAEKEVNVGDLVRVQECRPLSKIIHFVFVEKLKEGGIVK